MLWSIVLFGAGWWVGRNWDMVKRQFNDKVKPKLQSSGRAKKIED